jgi:16S rRNA (cytosine967-C5)-methyltransferase
MSSAKKKQADARRVVLDLLMDSGDFPTRQFGDFADRAGLEGQDRGFARELLSGTLRHCRKLDAIFEPHCKRRVKDEALRWTLRLGTYQLFFLAHIPDHAAVHATLESARPLLRELSGFANGVMRQMQRSAKLESELPENYLTESFSRKRLVIGKRSWMFPRPVFSNPKQDAVEFWATEFSFPNFLARRWFQQLGEEAAVARMKNLQGVPALWIRVNPLRSKPKDVRAALEQQGVEVVAGSHPLSFRLLKHGGNIPALPGFAEGHWAVQDLTSLETLALAEPQPGDRILDLCAAPGGKSFAAFELSGGKAEVWACDVDQRRLSRLAPEAKRLGHNIQTKALGSAGGEEPDGPWDLILLDVPCSNTGVLHKRLEARGRFSKTSLRDATTLQNLIRKAYLPRLLGPNTRVLWSTCSLEPEENQEMAARIARHTQLEVSKEITFEPDGLRAGGYAALLR